MQRLQCIIVEKIGKNVLTLYFFQQRFRLTDSLGKSSAGISDLASLVIVYLGYVWGEGGGGLWEGLYQKHFIYRLLTRHDFPPVWLVADK